MPEEQRKPLTPKLLGRDVRLTWFGAMLIKLVSWRLWQLFPRSWRLRIEK
jgi:hypothetical protein